MVDGRLFGAFKETSFPLSSLLAWALAATFSACAPASYAVHSTRAARAVEHARRSHAGEQAPYELTLAIAYLDKAREQSSKAAYQDAIRLAETSEQQAQKALELSRQRRRGAEQ